MSKDAQIDEFVRTCLLGRTRRLARVVTGIYEEELRPFKLKASQFSLLVIVARAGPIRRSDLGRLADFDPSTITRNLAVMANNGWIEDVIEDEDGRGNPVRATAAGVRLLEKTTPAWRRAQDKTRELLGEDRVASLASLYPVPRK